MDMFNDLNNFYIEKEEPIKSCFMVLKEIIPGSLQSDPWAIPIIPNTWNTNSPFIISEANSFDI